MARGGAGHDLPEPAAVSGRYTRIAVVFHWLVAVLVIGNIALAWTFKVFDDYPWTQYVTNTHKTVGITVLGLALLRLSWRIAHRPPPFNPAIPRWQAGAARFVHGALYFMIIAMPLSGWIYDSAWEWAKDVPIDFWGLFEMPRIPWVMDMPQGRAKELLDVVAGEVHNYLSYLLYALLAAHLAGAIKHQWFDRIPTLQRMTFRGNVR